MNDESLHDIEQQLGAMRPVSAPAALRSSVLADVSDELRSARWDRRLARAAVVLLIVGVGLNAGVLLEPAPASNRSSQVADANRRQTLVNTAVAVAEATDARTGGEYARQMAAVIGHTLTADDVAAIDAALHGDLVSVSNGKKG